MALIKDKRLPNVSLDNLPIGLVAIGNDLNLYVVTNQNNKKNWALFKKAATSCHSINPQEVAIVTEPPSIQFSDAPEIIMSHKPVCFNCDSVDDLPRKRGRPKSKVCKNRPDRLPTEYNIFFKQEMLKLTHIHDSSEKMKIVANLWNQLKLSL